MHGKMTLEELLLDDSFVDYCLNNNSEYKTKWEQLRAADPELSQLMDEAKELLSVIGPQLPAAEVNVEVDKMRKLFAPKQAEPVIITQTVNQYSRRLWISLAAAACVIITASYFLWPAPLEKPVTLTRTEHATGFGERLQVLLPDGSTVILNANSSLSYNTDFNNKDRQLQLSGEAYFDVAGNPSKPFIVSTDQFSTTAIGTAFYIHGRRPSQAYTVNLIEGKISVQNGPEKTRLLQAGEEVTWSGNTAAFTINRFDTTYLRQWIDGRLQFQQAATGEVLNQLAKWYAVEIEDVRKKRGTISITGDYSNKPLQDILKAICFSLSCRYTIAGNKIIIQ